MSEQMGDADKQPNSIDSKLLIEMSPSLRSSMID